MNSTGIRKFWDRKILNWEDDKYSQPKIWDVNSSVKCRLRMAELMLKKYAKNQVVLELGCGSARLLDVAEAAGVARYIGVDISARAIEAAREREKSKKRRMLVEFHCASIEDADFTGVDLCFSLGLLDWLRMDQLQKLVDKTAGTYFLHSYSEERRSLSQFLHGVYVYFMYGHRTKKYRPRYYSEKQIRQLYLGARSLPLRFYRSRRMSFGTLVYHLPNMVSGRDFD